MDPLIQYSGTENERTENPPTAFPAAPDADKVKRALPRDIYFRGMGTTEEAEEFTQAIAAGWLLAEGRTRQVWTERTIDIGWSGCYYVPPYFGTVTISNVEYYDGDNKSWEPERGAWFLNGKHIFELDDQYLERVDWRFRLSYAMRTPPQGVILAVASLAAWELSTGILAHEASVAPETPESNLAQSLALAASPTLRGDPFRATSAGQMLRWYQR